MSVQFAVESTRQVNASKENESLNSPRKSYTNSSGKGFEAHARGNAKGKRSVRSPPVARLEHKFDKVESTQGAEELHGPSSAGGLRKQIAGFKLPRFMEVPVLDPPQDVLEVVQLLSEIVQKSEQDQPLRSNVPLASSTSSSIQPRLEQAPRFRSRQHKEPAADTELVGHSLADTEPAASKADTEPAAGPSFVPMEQMPDPMGVDAYGADAPDARLDGRGLCIWTDPGMSCEDSSHVSMFESVLISPQEMAEARAAATARTSQVQAPVLVAPCLHEAISVSRSSTRSSFVPAPVPPRGVQTRGAGAACQHEEPGLRPMAEPRQQPILSSYTIPPPMPSGPFDGSSPSPGPRRDSATTLHDLMPGPRRASFTVPSGPFDRNSHSPGPSRDSSGRQARAAPARQSPERGAVFAFPSTASPLQTVAAQGGVVPADLFGAAPSSCTGGHSAVLPLTAASVQGVLTIAQSPASEARCLCFAENSPSFLPTSPVAAWRQVPQQPTSPVAAWRQVPQQPLPPNLTRSKSLEVPPTPLRSSLIRSYGSNYNIPDKLGVDPARWLRPTSPGPKSPGSGVPWVGASPQRNSIRPPTGFGSASSPLCKPIAPAVTPGNFVEELVYSGTPFDPTVPAVRTAIFDKLGTPKNATIVQMSQEGGLNVGMWLLTSASGSLILKLVPHERRHPMIPTEAEQFVKLSRDNPTMTDDHALAFPTKIFGCREQGRERESFDLIVMRKAPGQCFAEVIAFRWSLNQRVELMREFHALGYFLAEIHARHNMQHGDFTPSNVFYDSATGVFTMVDVADFGSMDHAMQRIHNPLEDDAARFSAGIKILSKCYGEQLYLEGKPKFDAGYKERKAMKL